MPRLRLLIVGLSATGICFCAASAFAAATPTAYVVGGFSNTVTPVDVATNTAGAAIPVGGLPDQIVITPDGRTVYVESDEQPMITPINTATNAVGAPINFGTRNFPSAMAVAPDGKTLYVATPDTNSVTPVDTATDKPGTPFGLGVKLNANALALSPDGKTLYVAGMVLSGPGGNTSTGMVIPVNTATKTPGTPIRVTSHPFDMAITPDGRTLYVADTERKTVIPIETATDKAGKDIGLAAVGSLAMAPGGMTLYVANLGLDTVTPINTATNAVSTPIKVGSAAIGLAITPDGKTLYASSSDFVQTTSVVTPISLATGTAGTPIQFPANSAPSGVAITPDQGPVASFTATAAAAGKASLFNASASHDPDGTVVSYEWNFGDGMSTTTASPTVTHVYKRAGAEAVKLTVTDNEGCSRPVYTGQTASCNGDSATSTQRVTIASAPGPAKGSSGLLSDLKISPKSFSRAGRKLHGKCVKPRAKNKHQPACLRKPTLRITYMLSRAANVTFRVAKRVSGRKAGGRCVAPTRKNHHAKRCVRLKTLPGKSTQRGKKGANRFVLSRGLRRGKYTLKASPAGGGMERAMFKVVK